MKISAILCPSLLFVLVTACGQSPSMQSYSKVKLSLDGKGKTVENICLASSKQDFRGKLSDLDANDYSVSRNDSCEDDEILMSVIDDTVMTLEEADEYGTTTNNQGDYCPGCGLG